MNRRFIERQILRMILEAEERTRGSGLGGGNYKAEIRAIPKALAENNPQELMRRLGVSKITADSDMATLKKFVEEVTSGDDTMAEAYTDFHVVKDKVNNLNGVSITVGEISPRDGAQYMRHAVYAGVKSGYTRYTRNPYVEILEGVPKIILYFADESGVWGIDPKTKKPVKTKPEPEPETKPEPTPSINKKGKK
jgi:hypothetical protein